MFRIGVFARLAGVSAKALRAYDELGLFSPAWVDPESAYRYLCPSRHDSYARSRTGGRVRAD